MAFTKSNYSHHQIFTVDATKVFATESGFVAAFDISGNTHIQSTALSTGIDINVVTDDPTPVQMKFRHIGKDVLHVYFSSLSSSVDTTIQVHYGYPGAVASEEDTTTFPAEYRAVLCFGYQNPDNLSQALDLSQNGNYPYVIGDGVRLQFDGANDGVDFGDETDFEMGSGDFTVMCDIMLDDIDQSSTIIGKYESVGNQREWLFSINSSTKKLEFRTSSAGTSSQTRKGDTVIPVRVPVNVAVVKSGTSATFYINGVADTDDGGTVESTLFTGTGTLQVGKFSVGSWEIDGGMWNAVLYKGTALTALQISDYVKTGNLPTTTNLVLHAKMDDGIGTTVTDSSPAGHDGTINGTTWVNGRSVYVPATEDETKRLYFAGSGELNNALPTSTSPPQESTGTIIGKIRPYESGSRHQGIFSASVSNRVNTQFGLWDGDGKIGTYIGGPGGTVTGTTVLKPYHDYTIGLSWDNPTTTLELWVNSVREYNAVHASATYTLLQLNKIGNSSHTNREFNGVIYEVLQYDRVLTQTEHDDYHDLGTIPSNPQVHLKMDEESGTSLADDSGNGYDFTISGAVWKSISITLGTGLAKGANLDGVTRHLRMPHSASLKWVDTGVDKEFTMAALMNKTASSPDGNVFEKESVGTQPEIRTAVLAAGSLITQLSTSSGNSITQRSASGAAPVDGSDFVYGVSYDATELMGGIANYIDGVDVSALEFNTGTYTGMNEIEQSANIGASHGLSELHVGKQSINYLMEADKAVTWHQTMDAMLRSNATFYSAGVPVSNSATFPQILQAVS